MRILPTLICLAVIAALALIYSGVRAARIPDAADQQVQLPAPQKGWVVRRFGEHHFSVAYPRQWHLAEQQPVAGSSGRWALGPKGATYAAMFITHYRLPKAPGGDGERKQIRREVEYSLRATGAPARLRKVDDPEQLGDRETWAYRYRASGLDIRTDLVLFDRHLFQIACQSRPGKEGEKLRRLCARVRSQLLFEG